MFSKSAHNRAQKMEHENLIQHDTATLKTQWETIAKSRMDAMKTITSAVYRKVTGLDENDPPELWRFAMGFMERPPDLTGNKKAKILSDHFQKTDPQFAGRPEGYQQFRDSLGTPKLRDTILALANRSKDDAELAGWMTKLVAIYKHGPISQVERENNGFSKTAQILLLNWIQEPFGNITGSLSFFSDRAMAKMVYLVKHGKFLPFELYTTEPERIRKEYGAFDLRPADRRAVKDLEYRAGKIHFVLNKTLTPKGR
jgi:hypothetical protein